MTLEKPSFWTGFLRRFKVFQALERDKAQLESFLASFPGEYCGWTSNGGVAYSDGLCQALDLDHINTIQDIQGRLAPGDAAALEGLFDRLEEHSTPFTMSAHTHDEHKLFKISGTHIQQNPLAEFYRVLWFEDVTAQTAAHEAFIADHDNKTKALEQFKTLIDHVPRPLWLRDADQNITWCNRTYCDFLGKSADEIIENQLEIFGQPRKRKSGESEESQPGKPLAQKALHQNAPAETRIHNTIKGVRILMNVTEIPLAEKKMTMGIAYNVTREEELETDLARYQSSNKELLEQLRSAIAIYSADQKLEFYNSSFAHLWHLEDKWLNKKPKLGDIMEKLRETRRLPEQADFRDFKKRWLGMFTNLIDPEEDMLYLPDGTALRMLVVPHSQGGLMMTFEDVSSRLELESSYNTLIAVQKETLDNLAEAVAVYGGDGRLKLCNPAFGRLWELNPEDIEGEPHISKIVEKKKRFFDKKDWEKRQNELISKGLDRIMHEGRLELKNDILIDYTTVPLPDGGVLITYTDVTDSVRVENALREKFTALEAAEKLKLDFLANVSYQLRTPLNAIMGFNEILDQEYFGPLNERQKQYTNDMRLASERLLELINDILDVSTLEAGYMTLQRTEFKIKDMLDSVMSLTKDWARKETLKVELKCPKDIGTIMADKRRLQQALINLIRNSIAYTPEGGKIQLIAKRGKNGITITVKDNGIGIQKEDKIRIFEPFERAQTGSMEARLSKGGAGLGLSLVKNIIALHGGDVNLESEPGKGTEVKLYIPFMSVPTSLRLSAEDAKSVDLVDVEKDTQTT